MAGLNVALLCGFEFLLVAAAICDARSYRIPNLIPATLLGVFVVFAVVGGAQATPVSSLAALAVGFVFGAGLWLLRAWGGGDAKLLAAMAPWVGLAGLPRLLFVMALAGGILALVILLKARLSSSAAAPPRHLPYGIAIAAAGTDWFILRLT